MERVFYTTRESVASAADMAESARNFAAIDTAIEAASRTVESICQRRFYPLTATRYFDFPNQQMTPLRLWLDWDELISITTLTAGGTTIAATDYFLEPANSGPPFTRVDIDRASSAAFASNQATSQRAIAITGLFGYDNTEEQPATLAEDLDSSETGVDITPTIPVGVGSVLRVDNERMLVTGRAWNTSGQTLQTPVTASMASNTVTVTTGSAFVAGEVISLDAEQMLITAVTGNNLTVIRAVNGTTLAAHTGSTVYWSRTLAVTRGALGTTAATHSTSTAVYRHVPPLLVSELTGALAQDTLLQRSAGYARTSGSGDSERETRALGIRTLMQRVEEAYGRRARMRSV